MTPKSHSNIGLCGRRSVCIWCLRLLFEAWISQARTRWAFCADRHKWPQTDGAPNNNVQLAMPHLQPKRKKMDIRVYRSKRLHFVPTHSYSPKWVMYELKPSSDVIIWTLSLCTRILFCWCCFHSLSLCLCACISCWLSSNVSFLFFP